MGWVVAGRLAGMSDPTRPPDHPDEGATPPPADEPTTTPAGGTTDEPTLAGSTSGAPVDGDATAAHPAADGTHDGTHDTAATPVAGDGTTPPPPHVTDVTPGEHHDGEPAPAKRNKAVVIVAAAIVLVLVAGAVVAGIFAFGGPQDHKIVTPATAGEMKRDSATEKQLGEQLGAAEEQFKLQDKGLGSVTSAVYNQSDDKRGPEGALVFLGGTTKASSDESAAKFIETVRKQATENGFKVTTVDAGDDDTKAVCAAQEQSGQKIAICAWATHDTRGELIPTVPGWDSKQLAAVLRDLRPDVEVDA